MDPDTLLFGYFGVSFAAAICISPIAFCHSREVGKHTIDAAISSGVASVLIGLVWPIALAMFVVGFAGMLIGSVFCRK